MKKLIFLMCLVLGMMSSIYAAPVLCPDTVAYSVYLTTVDAAGGCIIGDKLFTNFTYSSAATGGASAVDATAIVMTTEGPAGSGASSVNSEYGFLFNALWFASSGQTIDSLIGYTVSVIGGASLIEDASLLMVGSQTGTGAAGVDETVCLNPPTCTNTRSLNVMAPSPLGAHVVFLPPVNSVQIFKDVFVRGGSNGTANISGVLNTVSQIPEPVTMSLMGIGLLGVGLLGRRLRK